MEHPNHERPAEHRILRGWIAARFGTGAAFLLLAFCGVLLAPERNVAAWFLAVASVACSLWLIARAWRGQLDASLTREGIRWHGGTLIPWRDVESITKVGVNRFRIIAGRRTIRFQRSRMSHRGSIAGNLTAWYGPITQEAYGLSHPWFWTGLMKLLFVLFLITINIALSPLFIGAFEVLLRWYGARVGVDLSDHFILPLALGWSQAIAFCWTWLDVDSVAILSYLGLISWSALVASGAAAPCGECRIPWTDLSQTMRNVPLLFAIKAIGISPFLIWVVARGRLK